MYLPGIVIAHFYNAHPRWYYIHVVIQILATLLFYVSIGLVFRCTPLARARARPAFDQRRAHQALRVPDARPGCAYGCSDYVVLRPSAHASLGVTVLVLVTLQIVLGGFLQFWPAIARVTQFLHRWNGRLVYVLAIVNVFLGVLAYQSTAYLVGTLGLWFALSVVLLVAAEVRPRGREGGGGRKPG